MVLTAWAWKPHRGEQGSPGSWPSGCSSVRNLAQKNAERRPAGQVGQLLPLGALLALDFNSAFDYLPMWMSDSSPIVAISALVKQFGRFAALRGVSAEFTAGRL